MTEHRIDLYSAFRNRRLFWDFLTQEARSEAYHQISRQTERHPSPAALFEWVADRSEPAEAGRIMDHIAVCEECAHEVLNIMRLDDELEQTLLEWADMGAEYEPGPVAGKCMTWASDLWEPQWFDTHAAAADVPKQTHVFSTHNGDIRLSVYWQGQNADQAAFLSLTWNVEESGHGGVRNREFRFRLVNPATRSIRCEISTGTSLSGEKNMTGTELGFDPSYERWAVAVIVMTQKY